MNPWFLILLLFFSSVCHAHSTGIPSGPWWTHWNGSPLIIFNLSLMTLIYVLSWNKMQSLPQHPLPLWRKRTYLIGIFFLVISLLSPVDTLSDSLAWVHMLQHTILMMIAAPALALGLPQHLLQRVLPAKIMVQLRTPRAFLRRSIFSTFGRPVFILFLYGITIWIWHLPLLYEKALHDPWVHDFQHLSFFITSFLFWRLIFTPLNKPLHLPGAAIIYLFVTSLHSMILGVLMAFSPVAWYAPYIESAPKFGLTAVEDQQIAGLIMWMPAGTTYVVAALYMILKLIESTSGTPSINKVK